MPSAAPTPPPNRAVHHAAWVLACATFLLIWMGGLVTTYAAGMAVPDWPTTFGYNLFLYPPENWLQIWDQFLNHGHRLLGSVVGLATIVLATLLWRRDARPAMWWIAGIALVGVCVQGTLGGLRVTGRTIFETKIAWISAPVFLTITAAAVVLLVQAIPAGRAGRRRVGLWIRAALVAAAAGAVSWLAISAVGDQLFLAKAHGCTAPAFFALAAAMVVTTSPRWVAGAPAVTTPGAGWIQWLAIVCTAAIYVRIVLSANLRHIALDAAPWWFTLWVWLDVIVAGVIALLVIWQFVAIRRRAADQPILKRRISLLAGIFTVQLLLGVTTWLTNYGWPLWFTENVLAVEYTVVAEGLWQVLSTTAHVAIGSLCLAASTSVALWSRRLLAAPPKETPPPKQKSSKKRQL